MGPGIGMFMASGDDGTGLAAGLVRGPADRVLFLAQLHGALVFVPAADVPQRPAGRQLVADIGEVAGIILTKPIS